MKRFSLRALSLVVLASVHLAVFGQQKPLPYKNNPNIIYKSYPNEDGVIRCHTMEMDSIRRANNPGLPSLEQEEMWLQARVAEFVKKHAKETADGSAKKIVVTIPVVVHVIHNGDAYGVNENIKDEQVQSQITVLNQDYRKMMGTNGYNTHPAGADVEVEFCLAVVDPNGNPTTGIDRVNMGTATWTSTGVDNTVKPATIWNPDNYMNMWTVNFGSSGLLGYAQFPSNSGLSGLSANGGAANTDGVVAGYQYFGSQQIFAGGTYSSPFHLGRTMTHEVGHYLGLRHIWGDGPCGTDDFCADTPESDAANYGCPTTHVSCSTTDMVQNYMDYTDDACMNIFTNNQKSRILTVLAVATRRASLVSSTACMSPTSDDAGISAVVSPIGNVCGTSITPEVTLTNFGNNTMTSVTINYNIDGVGTQTYSWTGSLASGTSVNVTLPSMTTTSGAHVFNAYTSNPNGVVDGNSVNDDNSSNFNLTVGGEAVTLTLTTDCWGYETYWEVLDASSNVVASGGNPLVPPGGNQVAAAGDPGAYGDLATISETMCLAVGCYDFVIYDDYGDGMYGVQWSCASNGSYSITDDGGFVLASTIAANADFGTSETNNFCLASPCTSTFNTSTTAGLCAGYTNGSITVSFASGNSTGATYSIGSGTQSTGTFNGLSQGSYTVTVVDGDACTSYIPVTLGGPSALAPTIVVTNISCNGQTDGQVSVTGVGGTPAYQYNIGSGNQASGVFTGLAAGPYTVTVTDNNGCTATVSGTVVEPAVLGASVGTITPEYFGNDGSVNLTVTGGTSPYTYAWTGPGGYTSNVQDPSNMPGGTYSVTITDSKGCTYTVSNVVVPSELGIDENGIVQFTIYPNPSEGKFNVVVYNLAEVESATITDVAGRVIMNLGTNLSESFDVDLSQASNGTYFMNIQTSTKSYTKRIVVKK